MVLGLKGQRLRSQGHKVQKHIIEGDQVAGVIVMHSIDCPSLVSHTICFQVFSIGCHDLTIGYIESRDSKMQYKPNFDFTRVRLFDILLELSVIQ